jgi:hypothetical protein
MRLARAFDSFVVSMGAGYLAVAACAVDFPDYPEGDLTPSQVGPPIGASCQSGAECPGGTCWEEGSELLADGSPARGFCTVVCGAGVACPGDTQCHDFGGGVSLCIEGCTHADGDPNKCHARRDVACAPAGTCLPTCSDDSDCASSGSVCNRRTALCTPAQSGTRELAESCNDADACRGLCKATICQESCVLGAGVTCRQPDGASFVAECVPPPLEMNAQVGDLGACGRVCCPGDCPALLYKCKEYMGGRYCSPGVAADLCEGD